MSEVITRDDLIELTCGHITNPNPDDPNGSYYCPDCGLHLLPIPACIDRQFIIDHAHETLESKLADLRLTFEARKRLDKPLGDNIEGLIAQHERALKRVAAGTYGTCAGCDVEIDSERLRHFPYAVLCVPCKSKEEEIPVPAKQGTSADPAIDASAEGVASVPAPTEGVGEASVSPASVDKTSSGAGPDGRVYADLALTGIHEGGTMLSTIPVEIIDPSPDNPREDVGDVSGLAATIAAVGLNNPIEVKEAGDRFHLTTGHRRLAAVKLLGWDVVTAHVVNTRNDQETEEVRLIENIQREDLTPLEEAKAFKRLIDRHGVSQRELADRVGRSQAHVSKRLALLDLPTPAVDLVAKGPDSGGISLEDAQKLSKIKSPKAVERVVKNFKPGDHWHSIDKLVADEVRKEKDAEKKRKLRAKLKAEGVEIISLDAFHNIDYNRRAKIGSGYDQLDVGLEKHKEEPCHAAYIEDYGSVRAVHVCKDSRRHGARGKSKLKGKRAGHAQQKISPERAARDKRARDLEKASKARLEFIRPKLGKNKQPKPADVFSLFVLALAADDEDAGIYEATAFHVCQFLGVKVKKLKADGHGDPERRVIRDIVAKDPASAPHVVAAIAIASIESNIGRMPWNADVDYRPYRAYFEWLERLGYELTDFEADGLAEKNADVEEAPAA